MSQREVWRLYALALTLVTDEDAAGDLFMDARDESDLRRRAIAWRRRRGHVAAGADAEAGAGLEPGPGPGLGPLPVLTAEQQAHALHLYRRGRMRRRFRLGIGLAGAFLLVGALLMLDLSLLRGSSTAAGRGLAADPVFAGRPVGRSDEQDGRQLAVIRAEATPGAVTVWWEITGPGLHDLAHDVKPQLVLAGSGSEWLMPAAGQYQLLRPDRLVGRHTYSVMVTGQEAAILHLPVLDGRPVRWLVRAPLLRVEEEAGARTLYPDQTQGRGTLDEVRLRQVTVAPTYLLVRYEATLRRHYLWVEAGDRLLEPVGPPLVQDRQVTALFEAPPAGAERLTIHMDPPEPVRSFRASGPEELTGITRDGTEVTAQLALSTYLLDRYTTSPEPLWVQLDGSYFQARDGARYPAVWIYQGEDPSRRVTLWRLQAEIPPGVDAGALQIFLPRWERRLGESFAVDLP